jgi:hypothetical protein
MWESSCVLAAMLPHKPEKFDSCFGFVLMLFQMY